MEAIVELIAAFVAALLQILFSLLEFGLALLAGVVEFVFLALTQGLSAATRQYKRRKEERSIRKKERVERPWSRKTAADTPVSHDGPSISLKQSAILGSILLFATVCGVGTWVVLDRIQKRRVAETHSQVQALADAFAEQIKDDGAANPEPGKLSDRDVWQQPMELFVDEMLLATLVVVRSPGPDRKTGSIDDILGISVIHNSPNDFGRELANLGIKALRDRVAELLPGGDQEQLSDDMNLGKE